MCQAVSSLPYSLRPSHLALSFPLVCRSTLFAFSPISFLHSPMIPSLSRIQYTSIQVKFDANHGRSFIQSTRLDLLPRTVWNGEPYMCRAVSFLNKCSPHPLHNKKNLYAYQILPRIRSQDIKDTRTPNLLFPPLSTYKTPPTPPVVRRW